MGWIVAIFIILIIICGCMFRLHCFTSYTCDLDKAYKEYKQWKELYEETTHKEIEVIDIENHGYYVTFHYRIKNKPLN